MSVQYEGREPTASGQRPGRTVSCGIEQHATPGIERRAGAVGRQHGEVRGEAGWHGFQVAVPAAAQRSAVQTDGLLVEGVEGGDEKRSAVGSGEQQGPAGGRPVGEKKPSVE